MADSQIAAKASFDDIRYAQLWEDGDVLNLGLGEKRGGTLVSICSAGDNALGMLLLDPARVVVVDLSPAQIACLNLRLRAYRDLTQPEFLELTGSRRSARRGELLARAARGLPEADQAFWKARESDVVAYGIGGVGKFERYFRLFRRYILPFAQRRDVVDSVFRSRPPAERETFVRDEWNNWRWRLTLKLFFSNFTMGRLGRDPAFFEHVEGSLADHVGRRVWHAGVDLDPADNPFLRWILKGDHGAALPLPWRAESYDIIRERLDRIEIRPGALERFVSTGEKADGFNLSDIFEYMTPDVFETVYGSLLDASKPGARLVYWNMMAPRRVPPRFSARVRRLEDVEAAGKAADKAFFYSDFVVEEARP